MVSARKIQADSPRAYGVPLVSCICLTTHPRRAALLPDAVRSYRQQSYCPRELIVVNDGEPLVSRAADVRVVNLPDRGSRWTVGEKRNVGVRLARGEYLATWDDDDVSLPDRLQDEVSSALLWQADYVMADAAFVADADLQPLGNCNRWKYNGVMASALIRRDVVVAVGGYAAADYREDVDLCERIRYLARGQVATLDGARWYVLRRHGTNITLDAGEHDAKYTACAARDPEAAAAIAGIAALRRGPGGDDVTPSMP